MELIISGVIIAIALYISLKVLKFLFIQAKKLLGWLGGYIVAIAPGAGTYLVTSAIFGSGTSNASLTSILTIAIIGTVMNSVA